jgi:ParB-like chromosome segregation protein Spo0J
MEQLSIFNEQEQVSNEYTNRIVYEFKQLVNLIESKSTDEKIYIINEVRKLLHLVSPFKNEPVDLVLWVKNTDVFSNDYNPNSVAPPEMELLQLSISSDGYTQPIVTMPTLDGREVIDGFHRHRVGKECEPIQKRVHGYLPVVSINSDRTDKSDRMAATIRHNRARGKHAVDSMSEIVVDLKKRNWSDEKIAKELGMDADEVLRLCQISGITEMFQDREFSEAWEADVIMEDDNLQTFEDAD